MIVLLWFGYSSTHSKEIINLSCDDRAHDSQVLLKLPSVFRLQEVFVLVGSKHHLLIIWQELPEPSTYLTKRRNCVKTAIYTNYVTLYYIMYFWGF